MSEHSLEPFLSVASRIDPFALNSWMHPRSSTLADTNFTNTCNMMLSLFMCALSDPLQRCAHESISVSTNLTYSRHAILGCCGLVKGDTRTSSVQMGHRKYQESSKVYILSQHVLAGSGRRTCKQAPVSRWCFPPRNMIDVLSQFSLWYARRLTTSTRQSIAINLDGGSSKGAELEGYGSKDIIVFVNVQLVQALHKPQL